MSSEPTLSHGSVLTLASQFEPPTDSGSKTSGTNHSQPFGHRVAQSSNGHGCHGMDYPPCRAKATRRKGRRWPKELPLAKRAAIEGAVEGGVRPVGGWMSITDRLHRKQLSWIVVDRRGSSWIVVDRRDENREE